MIADLVGVHPRTVTKWIDAGELKGVKLPGGERRVHRQVLREFCVRYEYVWAIRELNQEEGIKDDEPEPESDTLPGPAPGKQPVRRRKGA